MESRPFRGGRGWTLSLAGLWVALPRVGDEAVDRSYVLCDRRAQVVGRME